MKRKITPSVCLRILCLSVLCFLSAIIIEPDQGHQSQSQFSVEEMNKEDWIHEHSHEEGHAHKEEAEAMMKEYAISLISPHLEKSFKQAIDLTQGDSGEFIGFPATCFAPDTDPKVVEEFYANRAALENSLGLPGSEGSRFNLLNRWTSTATDGGGLGQGDFTTLTWSYVPDGTAIGNGGCGVPDQGTFSSDFISFFNGIYGPPTTPGDYTTAPWHAVFISMFDSWSDVSGLNFVYEPNDDGATVVTGGTGIIGTRGDFRISGHRIDGNSNVLACNYFPQNGDMIIDTDDNYYSNNPGVGTTNVLTHEIGHGLGILHVCPVQQTKLMEPFVTTVFTGPQEDDILATNRNYGDPEGDNGTSGAATFLGSTANPVTYTRDQRSIDDNGDIDYFSLTVSEATLLSSTLTPTGTEYLSGVQNAGGSCSAGSLFDALTVADIMFEVLSTDGTTVLATADANGAGVAESVTDISLPAAGTYYVRVSQQGGAVDNVQMYDLSISLAAAVLSPAISFAPTTGNAAEGTDCAFTDVDATLVIGAGASANADVSFSIDGSSTATQGVDFDLMTTSVTFNAGSTASQTMTLRIYHDAFVEGDETIVVNTSLNANGGDATLNPAADTFTYTIDNDDAAPIASVNTTVFSADFEDVTGWTVFDNDGDGNQWGIFNPIAHGNLTGRWAGSVTNLAVIGGSGTLTPDNFLFSPSFSIPADATNTQITFEIGDLGTAAEHYAVYFASTNTVAAALSGTLIEESNTIVNDTETRTVNLASLAGQTGVLAFRHYNTTGNSLLMLDTVDVVVTQGTGVQTAVNTANANEFGFESTGTAYAYDDVSSLIMANLTNNNSFDYGCTSVNVNRSGTGAQAYNGSTSPDFVTDKTFIISPANTTGSGNVDVTFYFSEAEIAGWEAATGLSRTVLVAARGTASSVTETAALTIGSFGTNVTLTGNFSGLDGTYYFGPSGAFSSCPGVAKTWNGSNWSPAGAPDATNEVILTGNYNTNTNGDLNACTLTVNGGVTLTVPGGTFASVAGDITVDGTLVIEHQGSVVQTDANPSVTNNGTINVNLTTPNLASRDFMVMGSPMSGEARESVWSSAFLVLEANTVDFVPHPDVTALFPGAENFADDNNDFWTELVTGPANPGEGFIVRPQTGYGQPGGIFSYTYDDGTLNTGNVDFTVIQNTPGPTAADNKNASPNALANPYPSAIFADDLINANAMIDEVYFWEHLTPPSPSLPGAGSMNFSMEDISMYNLSGGTAAASDPGTSTEPNGYISTGQGFGIKASAAGTATFTNAMRRTGNNNTLRLQGQDRERIWLSVATTEYEMQKQTLVAFDPAATQGMDPGYDSRRLATVVSLYTHLQDGSGELGIQNLGGFDSAITVPMGFSTLIDTDTEYKVFIGNLEGAQLTGSDVYLIDNLTGAVHDLRSDSYSFTSGMGTFHNRFTLQFTRGTLGTDGTSLESIAMFPNPTTGELNISSPQAAIEQVEVHDLMGRKVSTLAGNGNAALSIDLSGLSSSVYFVTVTTDQGILTKKVIKK